MTLSREARAPISEPCCVCGCVDACMCVRVFVCVCVFSHFEFNNILLTLDYLNTEGEVTVWKST